MAHLEGAPELGYTQEMILELGQDQDKDAYNLL